MTRVYTSRSRDPFLNLAAEEWLLRDVHEQGIALFLYRNRPSVVLGRNQNPWLECDVDGLPGADVTLARRISGGGAVYHDPGNLNVALIAPRAMYEPTRHVALMREALRRLGVEACIGPRQELLVQGGKVTGSAFMLTGRAALQHGTLLVDSNLGQLRACLAAPELGIRTKATASVPAGVVNLIELCPSLDVEAVEDSVLRVFGGEYGSWDHSRDVAAEATADPRYRQHVDALRSWEWIHGRTPVFEQTLEATVSGRTVTVTLTVRRGVVTDVNVEPSDVCPDTIDEVSDALCGVRYGTEQIRTAAVRLEASGKADRSRPGVS